MIRSALPSFLRRSRIARHDAERRCGHSILSGPFAGMRYARESVGSVAFPKLLGTYELEIADWIESLLGEDFAKVVNVGAGEGYYACGVALRCPTARVVAFEADTRGQDLIARIARANGLEARIAIRGLCAPDDLRQELTEAQARSLVLIDAEGAERTLLDPSRVPELRQATILAEIHDFIDADIGASIRERFRTTHRIEVRESRPRRFSDLPFRPRFLAGLFARSAYVRLLGEERPTTMTWLLLRPRPQDASA